MSSKVSFELTIRFEEREDRHVAFLPDIGSFSYGATQEAAEAKAKEAVAALVDSFRGDRRKLAGYLERHGVPYTDGVPPTPSSEAARVFEFDLG